MTTELNTYPTPCAGLLMNHPCGSYEVWVGLTHAWCKRCGKSRPIILLEQEEGQGQANPPNKKAITLSPRPMAQYLYFKPSGKWKYDGYGATIPSDGQRITHDRIREANDGKMPGITGDGKEFTIVIIPQDSFPIMVPAEQQQ